MGTLGLLARSGAHGRGGGLPSSQGGRTGGRTGTPSTPSPQGHLYEASDAVITGMIPVCHRPF